MYKIDHDTFKQLWDEHFRPLVYLCRKHNAQKDAEDIVADKFTKPWEIRDRFNDPVKVKAFLYISVMNAVRNGHKRISKFVEFNYNNDVANDIALEEIEYGILAEIYKEINELPLRCRTVFEMRVFDRKSYAEIASRLNIAIRTVDCNYQYARKLLRKRIRYEF